MIQIKADLKSIFAQFAAEVKLSDYKIDSILETLYYRYTVENSLTKSNWDKIKPYLQDKVLPHKIEVYKAGIQLYKDLDYDINVNPTFELALAFHDLSKFSAIEMVGYATHDFSSKGYDPVFERAWHHHKMNNPHHPEYWHNTDREGKLDILEMNYNYILEMIADWIGAGKTYGNTLEAWLPNNINSFIFHPNTAKVLSQELNKLGFNTAIRINDNEVTRVIMN